MPTGPRELFPRRGRARPIAERLTPLSAQGAGGGGRPWTEAAHREASRCIARHLRVRPRLTHNGCAGLLCGALGHNGRGPASGSIWSNSRHSPREIFKTSSAIEQQ